MFPRPKNWSFFGVQKRRRRVSFFCRHRKREPPPLRYFFLNPLLLLLPFEFSNSRYKKDTVLFAQHKKSCEGAFSISSLFSPRVKVVSLSLFSLLLLLLLLLFFALGGVSSKFCWYVQFARAHELEHLDLNSPPVLNWSRERIGR